MRAAVSKRRLLFWAALLCAGLVYAYVLVPAGWGLPCPFRALTGLKCPGCGLTSMCVALLHGRFLHALGYNVGLAAASPLLLYLALSPLLPGAPRRRRAEGALAACLLAAMLIWGVARNLWGL